MVGYASDVDMDGHGRILLTRELREYRRHSIDKRCLVGVGIKFELWSEERWNAKRDSWRGGRRAANHAEPTSRTRNALLLEHRGGDQWCLWTSARAAEGSPRRFGVAG